jgi:hypothetical protein
MLNQIYEVDHEIKTSNLTEDGFIFNSYIKILTSKIKEFKKTKSTLLGKIIYYTLLIIPITSTIILTIIMTEIKIIVKILTIIYKKNFNLED